MNERLRHWWAWTKRHTTAAITAAVAFLVALTGTCTATVKDAQHQPEYLATAVMAPPADCDWRSADVVCRGEDANLQVYRDHVNVEPVRLDKGGHGKSPSWTAEVGPVPDGVARAVGYMGWPVSSFMAPVMAKQRPLRYCDDPVRAFNPQIADAMVRGLHDKFDAILDVLPPVTDCGDPDVLMTSDAIAVCGQGALGCAALKTRGSRYYVDVSVDGPGIVAGRYPLSSAYIIQLHEGGHGVGDMAHAGRYGGEGGSHPHPTDMDAICLSGGTAYSCSNTTGRPAREDWLASDGSADVRLGGRFRGSSPPPNPTPPPTPSPTPTPQPTAPPPNVPTPSPPSPPLGAVQVWAWRCTNAGHTNCTYVGVGSAPVAAGEMCWVIARGSGVYLTQACVNVGAVAATSDIDPAGLPPVPPREEP